MIREFLADLDDRWPERKAAPIPLRLIGSTALMLRANYVRITKDADILQVQQLTPDVCQRLTELAGQASELARRHNLYLEIVAAGLPFLPRKPLWREIPKLRLKHFEPQALDVVDVVVSKLARFNANDVHDIDAMVAQGLVPHRRLINRFRAAVEAYEMDSRADRLPTYIRRLHQIERDGFGAGPTNIEVPAGVASE
jgi:hypothetical protein